MRLLAAWAAVLVLLAPITAVAATPAFPAAKPAGPPRFDEPDALKAAVETPTRSAANRARDGARHPLESLTFWGVQPGNSILELSPGGGYWTEILAPFAKATGGRYVATGPDIDSPDASERGKAMRRAFEARFGVKTVSLGPQSGPLAPPGSVDFILTARNIHNWMQQGILDKVMADAYAALRPGGILAVEEHRSDPRPMKPDARDGYVSEGYVVAAARKAGFRLDATSEINANPKDTKDHAFGVWTLPPTRQSAPDGQPPDAKFDHSRYDAIGESDRMTLRFRKPD